MSENRSESAESSLVSARKYRPGRFEQVLSQEHVSTTLMNALLHGRLSHAYLFAGPRGVGKTTMARILAKAVNCERREGAEPCDECSMCEEIRAGHALDVMEIDGASNRRIADVRDLRQKVGFAPSRARMKIYIIDEVHMLTNEAFNALLKTLEEPPENVIFIFATTEPHKVPLTILSRCQRFDFRSIPNTEIAGYLKKVADQEKLEISEGTLYAIARKAEGSLRDALSLFDQIRAFAGGQFGERDVVAVTGMIEDEIFLKILRSISAGDGKGVVEGIGEIAGSGKDLGEFYDGLLAHLRNLILLKVNESLREVCDVPASSLEEYLRIAPLFDERILFRMFDHLAGNRVLFRNSDLKRIILETLLLRFSAGGGGGLAKAPQAEDAAEQSAGEDPGVQPASEPPAASPLPQAEETVWRTFLDQIRKKKVTLFGLLSAAKPVALKEHAFSLSMECRNSFIKDQLKLPEHVSLMNECISGICGRRVFFEIEYEKGQPAGRGHSSKPGTDPAVERLKQLLDAEEIGSGPPAGSS